MKILHTSDWHLGKKLEKISRINEQKIVLSEIIEIVEKEQIDAIVICGDIFDSYNPPIEAEDLYFKTLKKLSKNGEIPVIIIAGNHDSQERIIAPRPLANECGIIVIGEPMQSIPKFKLDSGLEIINSDKGFFEILLPKIDIPLRIIATPYANELRLKTYLGLENKHNNLRELLKYHWQDISEKYLDNNGVNILISHSLIAKNLQEIPDEPEGEKPILTIGGEEALFIDDLPENLHYAGFGHLHRFQVISNDKFPVVYSGSPLAYSLSEADQNKYCIVVEIDSKVNICPIKLTKAKKIRRKKFSSVQNAIKWLQENQDCLVEITIETEEYLSSDDRNSLYAAHNGIIGIVPEIKFKKEEFNIEKIDLTKDIQQLFIDFFKKEKGTLPNEEILKLFKEIIEQ